MLELISKTEKSSNQLEQLVQEYSGALYADNWIKFFTNHDLRLSLLCLPWETGKREPRIKVDFLFSFYSIYLYFFQETKSSGRYICLI